MSKIKHQIARDELTLSHLLRLWEGTVRATHTFLSDHDISEIQPDVYQALKTIDILLTYDDDKGSAQGFIGIANQKIEMLFIAEEVRGQGLGKALVTAAIEKYQVKFVDVNAQNAQAVGFYQHIGFQMFGRSECDEQGRPFPILHFVLID